MRTLWTYGLIGTLCVLLGSAAGYHAALAAPSRPTKPSPPQTQDLYDKGVALAEKGQYDEARKVFAKLTRRDRDNAEAFNMLGYTQRKTGRLDEAFGSYQRALKLKPQFPEAREYLGEAHLMAALKQAGELQAYGEQGRAELAELVEAFQQKAKEAKALMDAEEEQGKTEGRDQQTDHGGW